MYIFYISTPCGDRELLAHHTARLACFEKTFVVFIKFTILLTFCCWSFIPPIDFTEMEIGWVWLETPFLGIRPRAIKVVSFGKPDSVIWSCWANHVIYRPVSLRWYLWRISFFFFLDTSLQWMLFISPFETLIKIIIRVSYEEISFFYDSLMLNSHWIFLEENFESFLYLQYRGLIQRNMHMRVDIFHLWQFEQFSLLFSHF